MTCSMVSIELECLKIFYSLGIFLSKYGFHNIFDVVYVFFKGIRVRRSEQLLDILFLHEAGVSYSKSLLHRHAFRKISRPVDFPAEV